MGGESVSWELYTILTVARLNLASDYVAISNIGAEAILLRNFLGKLGIPQQVATPIFTDSTGPHAIVRNPCNLARTKHIELHYHYAREHVAGLDYSRVKSS